MIWVSHFTVQSTSDPEDGKDEILLPLDSTTINGSDVDEEVYNVSRRHSIRSLWGRPGTVVHTWQIVEDRSSSKLKQVKVDGSGFESRYQFDHVAAAVDTSGEPVETLLPLSLERFRRGGEIAQSIGL
jgi:hypothetical protein